MSTQDAPDRDRKRGQLEFPLLQTHSKGFEAVMVGLSLICVVIVLVIVLGTDIGNLSR